MTKTLIELHVPCFEAAKDFYSRFGFSVVREDPPSGKKGYLIMDLDGNRLCFWGGNSEIYNQSFFKRFPKDAPRGLGVEIVLQVPNVDEAYTKVKDILNIVSPIKAQPWGLRDFRLVDPFGFYLRVTSLHDPAALRRLPDF